MALRVIVVEGVTEVVGQGEVERLRVPEPEREGVAVRHRVALGEREMLGLGVPLKVAGWEVALGL
jgi:hypothetical protein